MDDNVELTVPAAHVTVWCDGDTAWASVLVPLDLLLDTANDWQRT